jgi:hypothetical protein
MEIAIKAVLVLSSFFLNILALIVYKENKAADYSNMK